MSYDNSNFSENRIILGEPVLTSDGLIELYQNDEYRATVTVDHVLESLQEILDIDLEDDLTIEEDGNEWIKAVSLRIAAAALRSYVDSNE